jgi:hypothetical protein
MALKVLNFDVIEFSMTKLFKKFNISCTISLNIIKPLIALSNNTKSTNGEHHNLRDLNVTNKIIKQPSFIIKKKLKIIIQTTKSKQFVENYSPNMATLELFFPHKVRIWVHFPLQITFKNKNP